MARRDIQTLGTARSGRVSRATSTEASRATVTAMRTVRPTVEPKVLTKLVSCRLWARRRAMRSAYCGRSWNSTPGTVPVRRMMSPVSTRALDSWRSPNSTPVPTLAAPWTKSDPASPRAAPTTTGRFPAVTPSTMSFSHTAARGRPATLTSRSSPTAVAASELAACTTPPPTSPATTHRPAWGRRRTTSIRPASSGGWRGGTGRIVAVPGHRGRAISSG